MISSNDYKAISYSLYYYKLLSFDYYPTSKNFSVIFITVLLPKFHNPLNTEDLYYDFYCRGITGVFDY